MTSARNMSAFLIFACCVYSNMLHASCTGVPLNRSSTHRSIVSSVQNNTLTFGSTANHVFM